MNHQIKRSGTVAAIAALSIGATAGVTASAASAAQAPVTPSGVGTQRILGLGSLPVLGPVLTPILQQVTSTLPAPLAQTLESLPAVDLGTIIANANPTQLTTILDGLSLDALTQALTVLDLPLLGDVLDTALGQTDGLNLVANLLTGASGGDLTALLGALDPTQLGDLVNTLLPAPLAGVLGGATGGDLTTLVGALDPAKITELLALGNGLPLGSLVTGLTGTLSGAAPSAAGLANPLAQLQALLAGLPVGANLLQLDSLLGTVNGLLTTTGVADLPIVGPLLESVTRVQATSGTTPALTTLASTLSSLLGSRPGSTPLKPTTTTTKPSATTPGSTSRPGAAASARARATIGKALLTKSRKSASFTVSCPKVAAKGCVVQVSASLAGTKVLKPRWIAVLSGSSQKVSVKLSRAVTKRLVAKGGTLTFRASTAAASGGAVTKALKVKKTAKRR
ncbi:hypothetical protein GKE82_06965 [Conexibacter sp. W3-3-2]|uniref:hypothetical protein n=1 Tax=Conexibacter sp. W3-3-2 TaxID=2675227 RepID=UPI0012B7FCA6|nr:hypothetical protein [Conexibacter sp. W3-3-2]MTD44049.1 hypothetical protein [Conexibacter sp. W3-3-2]